MKACFVRYIFSVLLLLPAMVSQAQEELIRVLKTEDAKKLDRFFTKGHEGHDHLKRNCANTIWYREILPNSKYRRVYARYRLYKVFAIVNDRAIVLWRMQNLKNGEAKITYDSTGESASYKPNEVFIDSAENRVEYKVFNNEFKSFYSVDFDKGLNFTTLGFGMCGLYGDITEPNKTINEAIDRKDIKEFSKWLRSGNVEYQLYAMSGYKHSGYVLDDEERKIIEFILALNVPMDDCSGCSSEISTSKIISQKMEFYDLLKK